MHRFEKEEKLGYALKADIHHYFDTIDQEILLQIIEKRIKDQRVIRLIKLILQNHKMPIQSKGMPIGNLTSQFFANVYLNELDQFVKNRLKVKYYLRYVDDFVILHRDKAILQKLKDEIIVFLKNELKIKLHSEKSRIILLNNGITFLGFRIFKNYRLLKKSNAKRIWKRLEKFKNRYEKGEISKEKIFLSLEGWLAYANFASTYKLRKRVFENLDILSSLRTKNYFEL